MRIVILGAGETSVRTAELLIQRGAEVIIVEIDRNKIEELEENLDCGFLLGDATRPQLLKEADPKGSDVLMCLTDNDQGNILASLIGRSLGFDKVLTRIEDPAFEAICRELELENVVVPSRTTGHYLADMATGREAAEVSSMLKDEARLFSFVAGKEDSKKVADLDLPEKSRAICRYRDGEFQLLEESDKLRKGDEVVILAHSKDIHSLESRWKPRSDRE